MSFFMSRLFAPEDRARRGILGDRARGVGLQSQRVFNQQQAALGSTQNRLAGNAQAQGMNPAAAQRNAQAAVSRALAQSGNMFQQQAGRERMAAEDELTRMNLARAQGRARMFGTLLNLGATAAAGPLAGAIAGNAGNAAGADDADDAEQGVKGIAGKALGGTVDVNAQMAAKGIQRPDPMAVVDQALGPERATPEQMTQAFDAATPPSVGEAVAARALGPQPQLTTAPTLGTAAGQPMTGMPDPDALMLSPGSTLTSPYRGTFRPGFGIGLRYPVMGRGFLGY